MWAYTRTKRGFYVASHSSRQPLQSRWNRWNNCVRYGMAMRLLSTSRQMHPVLALTRQKIWNGYAHSGKKSKVAQISEITEN